MTQRSVRLQTGQQMPKIGLGTSRAKGDDLRKALNVALEHGYRSIDTAYIYFNEELIGEVLQEWFSQDKLKREEVFITTKLASCGNRQSDVDIFMQLSLRNLQLNYVDLFLVHIPVGLLKGKDQFDVFPKYPNGELMFDLETNLEDLWKAMEDQVDKGRAKAIGVSNFNWQQMDRILKIARITPAVNQVEAHAYLQQRFLLDKCKEHGIVMCAYAPLGAPFRDLQETFGLKLVEDSTVMEIAGHHGKSPSQVLLKFLLQIGFVVIPKSVTPKRIKENFELFDFTLEEKELAQLAELDRKGNYRIYHFRESKGIEKLKEYPF